MLLLLRSSIPSKKSFLSSYSMINSFKIKNIKKKNSCWLWNLELEKIASFLCVKSNKSLFALKMSTLWGLTNVSGLWEERDGFNSRSRYFYQCDGWNCFEMFVWSMIRNWVYDFKSQSSRTLRDLSTCESKNLFNYIHVEHIHLGFLQLHPIDSILLNKLRSKSQPISILSLIKWLNFERLERIGQG
jgi:hypothetical protein